MAPGPEARRPAAGPPARSVRAPAPQGVADLVDVAAERRRLRELSDRAEAWFQRGGFEHLELGRMLARLEALDADIGLELGRHTRWSLRSFARLGFVVIDARSKGDPRSRRISELADLRAQLKMTQGKVLRLHAMSAPWWNRVASHWPLLFLVLAFFGRDLLRLAGQG